jgi:4-hydroxy-3-polyprenylbenzoate decarboxylase
MSAGSPTSKRFILGISGASGAIYADRILTAFAAMPHQLDIVASKIGGEIFRQERGRQLADAVEEWIGQGARMRIWEPNDFYAPFSSGSQLYDGMAVVPCSAGAMGRIAAKHVGDLLSRAADVC